jgi:hypothetical protein
LKKELQSAPAPQPGAVMPKGGENIAAPQTSRPAAVPAESKNASEPGMSPSKEQEKRAGAAYPSRSDTAAQVLQKTAEAPRRAMQMPMAQEWKGDRSGITSPATLVIKDAQAWAELWRRHDPEAAVPSVDFSKKMAVAVFQGSEKPVQCSVRITGILKQNDTTRILYSCSQEEQEEETVKPSLFHIKVIARSEGSVVFKKTDR